MSAPARVCFAVALLAGFSTSAQQILSPTASSRALTLHVAVSSPSSSGSTAGLQAKNFKLLDNKVERAITSVKDAGADPVSVILVVDAVNIGFTRVAYARDQVQKFLKSNGGRLVQPTTIAIVTDKGAQIQKGFSQDGGALSSALGQYEIGLRVIRRDSGIWGANERFQVSLTALREILAYGRSVPGRKLVLWVSPGWPLLSGAFIDLDSRQQNQIFTDVIALSQQMQDANVTLYDVNPLGPEESLLRADYYKTFLKGVSKPGQTDLADLSLQVLAAHSGGLVVTGNSDVAGNLAKCLADARSGYDLTFETAAPEKPNEYHQIQVVVDQPAATVRTRDVYYAQP